MVLGKEVLRDTTMDLELAQEIFSHGREDDDHPTIMGGTMCADDFYEGTRQSSIDYVTIVDMQEQLLFTPLSSLVHLSQTSFN